jgi:DNA-binding LacI/PurR family transcriptional regulator
VPKTAGATLKDIAERAGCSITVVSKTLNNAKGSAGASQKVQERILRIAGQLGYRANYHARALQTGKTGTLGLVSSLQPGRHHHNYYWNQLIQGIDYRTRAAGHDLLIIGPTGAMNEVQRGIECLHQKRIDALIVPTAMYAYELPRLEAVDGPLVFVADPLPRTHAGVTMDLRPGVQQACKHLADLGHRKVLWCPLHSRGTITDDERHTEMKNAAKDASLSLRLFPLDFDAIADKASIEPFVEDCRKQFAQYFRSHSPCPAVVCYSERVAMGLYAALAGMGLRVPQDVSVVSFDDIYAHATMPSMTVVSMSLDKIGEKAAELAMEMVSSGRPLKSYAGRIERVPTSLVIRQSTGAFKS